MSLSDAQRVRPRFCIPWWLRGSVENSAVEQAQDISRGFMAGELHVSLINPGRDGGLHSASRKSGNAVSSLLSSW